MKKTKLAPPAERRTALEQRFPIWTPMTLHGLLDKAVVDFPARPLILSDHGVLSYADAADQSKRLAAGLAGLGIGPGDKVALVLANYPEFVVLKHAISRLGAIAVPVNILLKAEELRYVLSKSDTKVLVTMDSFRAVDHLAILDRACPGWEGGASAECPRLERVVVFATGEGGAHARSAPLLQELAAVPGRPFDPVEPQAVCDIIFTSGTTGPPKGVQLTHDMLIRTAFGSAYARAFEDGRRVLFALPMFHVFGYVEGMLSVPFVGGAILPQLKFDPQDMLRAAEQHGATDALLIPAMSLALNDIARSSGRDLSRLHSALASGGKAPPRLWKELRDGLELSEITTGYGMTETTASTTVTLPEDPEERLLTTNGRLRNVGPAADPALDGLLVEYRVADPVSGAALPSGEVGELQARGLGVTSGYYRNPEATAAAFTSDGWLRTGDLGTLDEDGYIALLGRTKESYRCGGEQVLPSEVEDALAGLDGVKQAHVAPYPDERMGEVGVAFVIPLPGATVTSGDVIAYAKARLARFKVPRHVLIVGEDDIPLTASGRAKKFELTRIAQERLESR